MAAASYFLVALVFIDGPLCYFSACMRVKCAALLLCATEMCRNAAVRNRAFACSVAPLYIALRCCMSCHMLFSYAATRAEKCKCIVHDVLQSYYCMTQPCSTELRTVTCSRRQPHARRCKSYVVCVLCWLTNSYCCYAHNKHGLITGQHIHIRYAPC